jgi:hypothetical protein
MAPELAMALEVAALEQPHLPLEQLDIKAVMEVPMAVVVAVALEQKQAQIAEQGAAAALAQWLFIHGD